MERTAGLSHIGSPRRGKPVNCLRQGLRILNEEKPYVVAVSGAEGRPGSHQDSMLQGRLGKLVASPNWKSYPKRPPSR